MSICNSKGISLDSETIVNSRGIPIDTAYNLRGDVIYSNAPSDPVNFTIMTFNVGEWYGYAQSVPTEVEQQWYEMYEDIFNTWSPDFLAMQEYDSKIGTLDAQGLVEQTDPYFYTLERRAIASKYPLYDIRNISFENQDGNEERYYLRAYINVGGRKICVISAHTSYSGEYPVLQCNELLHDISREDYFIVCGDLNLRVDELHDANYEKLNGVWESHGYNSASGEQFGIKKTWRSSVAGTEWHGIDQIFTSSNITMNSVTVDDMKINKYASLVGNHIDHCPLVANVTIN